jgi:hypothetical protein
MTQELLTPPPELFTEWLSEALLQHDAKSGTIAAMVADKAAQWGADHQLEALLVWLRVKGFNNLASDLLFARRPKPPSLKEQALASLAELESPGRCDEPGYESLYNTIRRALEALND